MLVVDDNALFRDGLRAMIDLEPGLVVVGEGKSFDDAVALAADQRPDAVILQAECPGGGLVSTVHQLRRLLPAMTIIVLCARHHPAVLRRSLGKGIDVWPVKAVTRRKLITKLREIDKVRQEATCLAVWAPEPADQALNGSKVLLSDRERQVLGLVAIGLSNAQIASQLDIVEGTVKRHLRNIFAKLGARSRIDAVNRAVAAALLLPPGTLDSNWAWLNGLWM
ncbi:response regulator transcription factor [Dactylosporangium sp. CA-092794]|uniref:response regulator transcription factor n=1 Tax=Dactylosporangium sp. CA-092794 TaxID=3239929 RepID=UPI003D8B4A6A